MDYKPKPIESLMNYLREGYNNIAQTVNKLLTPNPSKLELALGYAGHSNAYQDRPQVGINDNPPNYNVFAASNVDSYEDKGNGQVVVRRTTGRKSITLDGKKANGQLEIYVGRELSDEGYKPKSTEISKISAVIKKSMQRAGIPLIKKR